MGETIVVRVPLRTVNSYLVIGSQTIIVDTGNPGYNGGILKAMQSHGVEKSDVSMIFLTHGHIDHFGSVYELKRHIDVPVVIQRLDAPYLHNGTQAPLYPINGLARFIKTIGKDMQVKKRYGLQADILFDDEMDLQDFGVNARAIATPGHTLGSSSVVLSEGTAIVGDLLMHKHFLFGSACRPPFLHDAQLHTESMRKLYGMNVNKFYPGHGKAIEMQELSRRLQPA